MKKINLTVKQKNILFIFLTGIVSILFYISPLMVIVSGDYSFHTIRIVEIARQLKEGAILPTLQPDNAAGMGYLVDVFYPSLFFYIPALLYLMGVPIMLTRPIFAGIMTSIACGISFCCIKKYKNNEYAYKFCYIYYLLPINLLLYHFSSSFFAVYLASLFLPVVYFGMLDLLENKQYKFLIAGISCILNINLMFFSLTCAMVLIMCLFNIEKVFEKTTLKALIKAVLYSIIINSFFLVPFIYYFFTETLYLKNPNFSTYIDNIEALSIIVSTNQTINILVTILALISSFVLFYILKTKNINKKIKTRVLYINIFILILITTMFPLDILSGGGIGFRILAFASLFMVLIILEFANSSQAFKLISNFCLVFIAVFLTAVRGVATSDEIKYVSGEVAFNNNHNENTIATYFGADCPDEFVNITTGEYFAYNADYSYWTSFGYLDADDVDKCYQIKLDECFKDVKDYTINRDFLTTTVNIDNDKKLDLTIPLNYYNGYVATYNGQKIETFNNNGLLEVKNIDKGTLVITYKNHPIQMISLFFAITSFAVIISFEKLKNKKKKSI